MTATLKVVKEVILNLKKFTMQKVWWISPSPIIKITLPIKSHGDIMFPSVRQDEKDNSSLWYSSPNSHPQLNDEKNLKTTKPVGQSTKFFKIPEQYLQFPSHKRQRKTMKPSQIVAKK